MPNISQEEAVQNRISKELRIISKESIVLSSFVYKLIKHKWIIDNSSVSVSVCDIYNFGLNTNIEKYGLVLPKTEYEIRFAKDIYLAPVKKDDRDYLSSIGIFDAKVKNIKLENLIPVDSPEKYVIFSYSKLSDLAKEDKLYVSEDIRYECGNHTNYVTVEKPFIGKKSSY